MNKPLVSYVIPTKNRVAWLPECIQSLLSQDVREIEVIVVNDGSTDGTKDFLESWAKPLPRVKIIHNEESLGAGPSRNIGMGAAESEIIGVCDDDDCYPTHRTTLILDWFKANKKSELVNFPYVRIGYFNETLEKFEGKPFDHETFKKTGAVSYFCNPSVAYKKAPVMAMDGYPKEVEGMTDDYQFIKKWVDGGHKIDFDDKFFACLHRILPNSMMSKLRGFDPRWVSRG